MNFKINWEQILEIIYKTGQITDLYKYSYTFLREIEKLIPFYAANFFLFDNQKKLISDPVCFNIDQNVLKAYNDYYWKLDDIRRLTFDQKEPIISTEIMNYKRWINTEYFNDFLAKNNLYYSCGIDIHSDNKLLGTISLFRSKNDNNFNTSDLIYLKILARQSSNQLKKLLIIEKLKNKKDKDKKKLLNKKAEEYNISRREKEVLKLILKGKHNKEIAEELFVSINKVKKHLSHIYKKTNVKNRTELTVLFLKRNFNC